MSNVAPITNAQTNNGFGTLGFNEGGTAFGMIHGVKAKGGWSHTLVEIENEAHKLTLTPIARPVANGPKLKGQLIDKTTGEVHKAVAWAPKNDSAVAYGLSYDGFGENMPAIVAPF